MRIEEGRYGTCGNCGKAIPKARLEAIPYALLCVKCASQEEQEQRASRVVRRLCFSITFFGGRRARAVMLKHNLRSVRRSPFLHPAFFTPLFPASAALAVAGRRGPR